MDKREITEKERRTARYAKALGHPVRIAVLRMLARRSCCYHGDMSQELPVAKSTLSQHLKELKEAGLIRGEIDPPAVKYCIDPAKWAEARECLNDLLGEVDERE